VYDREMKSPAARDLAAFVLAGGKSTRMGSDKAFIEYEGRTLVARTLELAHAISSDVYIVGGRDKFAVLAAVVEDKFHDCGPLGGIHAALRSSSRDLNLMLAVDMPFVSEVFLRYLIEEARGAPGASVIVPRRDGRWQPLCAVYRREFADDAEAALVAGRNRIDLLFNGPRIHTIEEKETRLAGFVGDMFFNLNTPGDLETVPQAQPKED
jgi:molybdopterin-guanine dinucleotide biosynthesis protein A